MLLPLPAFADLTVPVSWMLTFIVTTILASLGLVWRVLNDSTGKARSEGVADGAVQAKLDAIAGGVQDLQTKVGVAQTSLGALGADLRRVDHDLARLRQESDTRAQAASRWRAEVRSRTHQLGLQSHRAELKAHRVEGAVRLVAEGDPTGAIRFLDLPGPEPFPSTLEPLHMPRPTVPGTNPGSDPEDRD